MKNNLPYPYQLEQRFNESNLEFLIRKRNKLKDLIKHSHNIQYCMECDRETYFFDWICIGYIEDDKERFGCRCFSPEGDPSDSNIGIDNIDPIGNK